MPVNEKQKKMGTLCLMLSTFFLPMGYDAAFKLLMDWTGSYWITDLTFYLISLFFFGLYLFFNKIRLDKYIMNKFKKNGQEF